MNPLIIFKFAFAMAAMIMALMGCSSPKSLVFADRDWHVSNHYGQIIDADTTYRMTFGNVMIPDPLTIISSADSVAKYPGMDRFIADMLHTAGLDNAEILFYAPQMQVMYVIPDSVMPPSRPSSVSVEMDDERPYTMWVNEFDEEDWTRDPGEMYTYTYVDKRKNRIMIVDFFDYGDTPIAQIVIFQSKSKATSRMKIPEHIRSAYWYHNLKHFNRDIEFWAHQIDAHRKIAFANHTIGQEQKNRRK